MFRKRHMPGILVVVVLLPAVVAQGCASLSPSAAAYPPEPGKGIEVSNESEGIIGCLGTLLYVAGQIAWGASGDCHR